MSSLVCVLVVLLSLQARSKSICEEEDVLTVTDFKTQDAERREQIKRELSPEDPGSLEEGEEVAESDVPPSNPDEPGQLSSETAPVKDHVEPDLKSEMESETSVPGQKEIINKGKRQICDRILEQLQALPCDNPVVITCGGEGRLYPCTSPTQQTPLRAALSSVDSILGAAQSLPRPLLPPPSLLPSQISPVQTLPISSPSMASNLLPGVRGIVQPGGLVYGPTRILTAEERRERQKGIFEGLLRFGTVVNHIDSFLTDKSKMFIRGLHRMVASEEDSRFS